MGTWCTSKQWIQRSLTKRTDKLQTKKQLLYWPIFTFHLLCFNAKCPSWRTQNERRRVFCPKDGYSIFLQNRGNILQYYSALKPKYGLLWKHMILKFQWLDIHVPDYKRTEYFITLLRSFLKWCEHVRKIPGFMLMLEHALILKVLYLWHFPEAWSLYKITGQSSSGIICWVLSKYILHICWAILGAE